MSRGRREQEKGSENRSQWSVFGSQFTIHNSLLLWTACWLIFFWPLLSKQAHLPPGDFAGQFFAFGQFQAKELLAWRFPHWSPGSYGGFPFAADTQAAVFYPPRWCTIWANQGLSYYALQLEGLLHIWLAGASLYGLVTHMTRSHFAGLVSAIAFGLGGYMTSYPLLQLALLETVAWLPLALLFVRWGVLGEPPLRWLCAAGLTLGMAQLAGHPQSWLHVLTMTAVYALYLMIANHWPWRRILAHGLIVGAIAVGVSAVAWLPALRFLPHTVRSNVDYAFVSAGFPLLNYLQLVTPRAVSFWAPEYVGFATLLFAVLAWRQRGAAGHEVWFWGATAAVGAWLSLGDKGILFEALYWLAPPFRLFRQQERLVVIVVLSVAVLGGHGVAAWQHADAVSRRVWLKQSAAFGAVVLLLTGLFLSQMGSDGWPPVWARAALLFTALILGLRWLGDRRLALWLVPLLLVDLLLGVRGAMDLRSGSPDVVWQAQAWAAGITKNVELGRIDSRSLLHLNLGELTGLEDVRGISPLKPSWLAQYELIEYERRGQLLNITHTLSNAALEESTPLPELNNTLLAASETPFHLYENKNALPRTRLVYAVEQVAGEEEAWARLRGDGLEVATTAILHPPLPNLPTLTMPAEPPTVRTERLAPNRLRVGVKTAVPAVLVISEWNLPGWRVLLDGERIEHFPVNVAQIGVLVPAGQHTVTLTYSLPGLVPGTIISILTLLTALVLLLKAPRTPSYTRSLTLSSQPHPPIPIHLHAPTRPHLPLLVGLALTCRLINLGQPELRPVERIVWYFRFWPFEYRLPIGSVEAALRLPSVLLSVVVLLLLLLLARRMRLGAAGWWTAVLFTLMPFTVQASQDARPLYWIVLLYLLLAALLMTVASVRWAGWLMLLVLPLAPFFLAPVSQHNAPPIAKATLELAAFLSDALRIMVAGLFWDARWLRWVGLFAGLLALYGYRTLRPARPRLANGAALGTAVPLLTLFLLQYSDIVFEDISLILAAPTFYFLLTTGLFALFKNQLPQKAIAVLLGVVLLSTAVYGTITAFSSARSPGYAELATLLDEVVPSNADAVLLHSEADAALEFYVNKPVDRAIPSFFEDQLLGKTAVYFIHRNADDPVTQLLEQGSWLRVSQLQAGDFYLTHYTHKSLGAPNSPVPPHQLGDTLTLQSAHVTLNNQPINTPIHPLTIQPTIIRTSLFWTAPTANPTSYTVFVHLLDGSGALVAQHDGIPADGRRPTQSWEPNEIILDIHEIAVPETAVLPLTLVVGMYDSTTVERLVWDTGGDALVLTTFAAELEE